LGRRLISGLCEVETKLSKRTCDGFGGNPVENVLPEVVGDFLRLLDIPEKRRRFVGGV